jgi:hypothetical protein
MTGIITIAVNAIDTEASVGWMARLYGLNKGYKATLLPTEKKHAYTIKRNGESLCITQAKSDAKQIKVELKSLTIVSMLRDLEFVGLITLEEHAKAELAKQPTLYRFGEGLKARADGFQTFVTMAQGTEVDVTVEYAGKSVALVVGAAIYGAAGHHQYGVFTR